MCHRTLRSACAARKVHPGLAISRSVGCSRTRFLKPMAFGPLASFVNLIEDTESRDLESGLHSGRISQRGVYTKSPSDGGRPERELAKRYKTAAAMVNAQWQRTARLLNSLAETYESFGRNDDISAERMGFI